MARNLIAVIGSVTAEDYGPIRLILHHAGIKPKVVRIDLTDLCVGPGKYSTSIEGILEQLLLEYKASGPHDNDWEEHSDPDADSLIGDWLRSKYPAVEDDGCALVFRSSDFADPTSSDDLFSGVMEAWSLPQVDVDDRPSRSELESLLR